MTVQGSYRVAVRMLHDREPSAGLSRLSSRKVFLAHLLVAAAMMPVFVGGFLPLDERTQVALGAVSVFVLCLAALQLVTGLPLNVRGIARGRVGPWYLLWGGFAFGLASVTWFEPQTGSSLTIALPSVIDGLAIFAASVVLWTVGYLLGPPRTLGESVSNGLALLLQGTSPAIRGGAIPWVLYGVGTATRLISVALRGQFGYVGDASAVVSHPVAYGQALDMLSTFTLFAVAAAAYRAFATGRGIATVWVLVGIETVVGALGGMKESFIVTLLAVLIPYGAIRRKLSLRLLLIGAFVFLWVVVPFNIMYRQTVRTDRNSLSTSAAVAAAPNVFSAVLRAGSLGSVLTDSSTLMLERVREIDNVAIITQLTPTTIPYRSPFEFVTAPVIGLIPRVAWSHKPVLSAGYRFSQEYYGLPSTMYTSSAITPFGDLYRHGGWSVLVAGMLLLGVGCRLFDNLFRPETDPRAVFFLLVFLPMLVKSEMDICSMLSSLPAGIFLATLASHLTCRSPRHPSAVAQ